MAYLPIEVILLIANHLSPNDLLLLLQAIPSLPPLLQSSALHTRNEKGDTILHLLAQQGRSRLVRLLHTPRNHRRLCHQRNRRGLTPLHLAVFHNHPQTTQSLLTTGCDQSSAEDYLGRTPLHYACRYYSTNPHSTSLAPPLVRILLAHGANPSARDKTGGTPLHTCIEYQGSPSTLQSLIDAGGDPTLRKASGLAPLFYAVWLGDEPSARVLLESGVDPSGACERGENILNVAAYNGSPAVVRLLLDRRRRLDVSATNHTGMSPLMSAAVRGNNEAIRLLLDAGSDISTQNDYGLNALHWAARNGKDSTVQLLLDAGADPSVLDGDGHTALDWAMKEGHMNVVKVLRGQQQRQQQQQSHQFSRPRVTLSITT